VRYRTPWTELASAVVAITALFSSDLASGDVLVTQDRDEWEAAVGDDYTTIRFNELPPNTLVTDQYKHLGVVFVDVEFTRQSLAFENDGFGMSGVTSIHMEFTQPMSWIGVEHPGDVQYFLYSDGELVFEGPWMIGFGTDFGGIVFPETFDEVIIADPFDNIVAIDDLMFGPAIPAPGGLALLVAAGLAGGRGRRR